MRELKKIKALDKEVTIKEDEIDLVELLQKIWTGRKTIFRIVFLFTLFGLFIAIFSAKEYTSKTILIPTMSEKKVGGSLSSLASMAGISLDQIGKGEIPPSIYPQIVSSIPFKKKMLEAKLSINGQPEKVSFKEYYTNIYSPGVLGWLKKYTIGLPGVLITAIRGSKQEDGSREKKSDGLIVVSQEEQILFAVLDDLLELTVDKKEGVISLSGNMPEPIASAQITEFAQQLLKEYIIEFKSKKAMEELLFIEELYDEKKKEYQESELKLALFQDQNQNVITATARRQEKKLQSDYSLKLSLFTELSKQLEAKKIQVKEDTPIFTIIEPVSVPVEKSKPRRTMILAIWIFLGIVVGIGVVFGREWIKKLKEEN